MNEFCCSVYGTGAESDVVGEFGVPVGRSSSSGNSGNVSSFSGFLLFNNKVFLESKLVSSNSPRHFAQS